VNGIAPNPWRLTPNCKESCMQLFISGSLAYDRIMDFPGRFADHIMPEKIHILNVCFMVNGLIERFGGTAGNIAYNLALLREKPVILSCYGKDFAPYREWLADLGLPLTGLKEVPQEFTAGAYITTDLADNQITGFNPGAMKYASDYAFDELNPALALAIVAPGNLEDMLAYTRTYKSLGVRYIFDPGQSIPAWGGADLTEMADRALALIANDYELEMFRQKTGLDEAALLKRTATLIITRGEQGSYILTAVGREEVAAAPARQVLDPTGAGDAYRAGLMKGLVLGLPWRDAARLGATLASFSVEQQGTQEHRLHLADFWARYTQAFGPPPPAALAAL
jgi:adenosine kinase